MDTATSGQTAHERCGRAGRVMACGPWGRSVATAAVVVLLALLLGACSSGGSEDAAPDEATAEEILTAASVEMAAVEAMAFSLAQQGATIPIDDDGQLSFVAADGRIVRPSSADAVLTVEALGFTTEIGAIAIDSVIWFTNPLSGEWGEAPESFTFDPAELVDPDTGLPALLSEMAPTAVLVDATTDAEGQPSDEVEEIDRDDWQAVEATASGARITVLTGGLITEATEVRIWIDRTTNRVTEIRFQVPVEDEISDWQLTITEYDIEAEINPPDLGT